MAFFRPFLTAVVTHRWCMGSLLLSAAALTGCATGPREITSSVETHANMAQVALPATYRMELLPSQSQQSSFAKIEAAAEHALQQVGLTRDPSPEHARLVVQVGASASQGRHYHPAYDDWFYGPRWGLGVGVGWGGPRMGFGMGTMIDTPPMVYYRSVKLVLRDQRTQQIVYETSAAYDEVRLHDDVIWGVLFDAALTDFPQPAAGTRTVRTTVQPLAATRSGTMTTAPQPAKP